MNKNELTSKIIGSAIEVHQQLGPGLLESAYRKCLCYELRLAGLHVEKEKILPLKYKEITLDQGYRIDLLVENLVVVELKTSDFISDVHCGQILTYMKLGRYRLGLILNFNETLLRNGIKRFIF